MFRPFPSVERAAGTIGIFVELARCSSSGYYPVVRHGLRAVAALSPRVNVLSGQRLCSEEVPVSDFWRDFPVALLERVAS